MEQKIFDLVLQTVIAFNKQVNQKIQVDQGEDAPLFGQEGVLDSLELVSLIVELEQTIEDQLGFAIVIADQGAMSQRRSPFKNIGSLAGYVYQTIQGGH